MHEDAAHQGDNHGHGADGRVACKTRVDEFRQALRIAGCGICRDVADYGGANAQVEQSVVTSHGKNQNPDSKGGIAQAMQDKGREKDSNQNTNSQAEPAGADILNDFSLAHQCETAIERSPRTREEY